MPDTRSSPFWAPKGPCRPPAGAIGARPDRQRRCAPGSRRRISSRSRPARSRSRPATRCTCTPLPRRLWRRTARRSPLYLRTSPEFACKKLLAAGERRIVEFAKVFRNRERGALHAPEFTLVEWYRAGEPYQTLMADCAAILAQAAEAAATKQFSFRGRVADPFAAPERLTVAEAFEKFAGIDLLATLPDGKPDRAAFARAAQSAGIRIADDDRWGDIFSRVLVERIESNLGIGRATILDEYPGRAGGAGAHVAEKSARRRTLRALCLRRRTRQRLCRAHRRRRAAAPARTRDGGERTHLRRALSARRGFFGRAGGDAGSLRHRARP